MQSCNQGFKRRLAWGALYGLAALITLLTGLALVHFDRMRQAQAEQGRREHVRHELENLRSRLEKECFEPVLRARGVAAELVAHGDLSEHDFLSLAQALTEDDPNIRDVSFSRGTVITYQYPLGTAEYQALIGRDYRQFPKKWAAVQEAIRSRKPAIEGPSPMISGGLGLFVRAPIILPAEAGKPVKLLGLVTIVVDSNATFVAAGLADPALPIRVALTRLPRGQSQREVLFGDETVLAQHPETTTVMLDNEDWQLNAIPRDGWAMQPSMPMARTAEITTFLFVAILALGTVFFTAQRERSRQQLAELSLQLQQSQKMESIGRLAGGVAHDFNNLLGVILGQGELLLREIALDSPVRERVDEIMTAGQRAAALTAQLLAFSRRQILEPEIVNLNHLLLETHRMLSRMIRENIVLQLELDEGVHNVKVDSGQLVQVIVNLAVNARDAMPAGGRLTLRTANVELAAAYNDHDTRVPEGQYVVLTVHDTGIGMSAETRAKIFEPFFTTKPPESGTGLGLATVHGIVSQSGGYIAVDSELGVGTSFKVYFPQVLAAETPHAVAPRYTADQIEPGTETVLLVEDAMALRTMIGENLRNLGYTVLAAANGVEALTLAHEHAGPIHLLMTDVVMPLMGGFELRREMLTLRPGLPVLFMTGYTDEIVEQESDSASVTLLQKPFRMDELAHTLRTIFDRQVAPPALS